MAKTQRGRKKIVNYDKIRETVNQGGFFQRNPMIQRELVEEIMKQLKRMQERGSWVLLMSNGWELIKNLDRVPLTDICNQLGISWQIDGHDLCISSIRDRIIDYYGDGTKYITGETHKKKEKIAA